MKHKAVQHYRYHQWANERIFAHLQALPDEVYTKEVRSVFSSIQVVLQHVYQADSIWLSVISGKDFSETMKEVHKLEEKSEVQSVSEMHKLYGELNEEYHSFFNDTSDLDLTLTINHPFLGKMKLPVSELVKHVVNHGTYHRGNIAAMLRQQGEKGVPTDYIYYLHEQQSNQK